MEHFLDSLQVRVSWANWQRWPAGSRHFLENGIGLRLWLVREGTVTIQSAEGLLHVREGDFLLDRRPQHTVLTPDGADWLSLGFNATVLGGVALDHLLPLPQIWRLPDEDRPRFEYAMSELIRRWSGGVLETSTPATIRHAESRQRALARDSVELFVCHSLAAALLADCVRHAGTGAPLSPRPARREFPEWLAHALQIMRDTPHHNLNEVARDVGFSPAQFRRLFQQWMGRSPRDWLKDERLAIAQRLLEDTDWPISQIARHLGFESASHFTRLWRRVHGLSPVRYRAASRSGAV